MIERLLSVVGAGAVTESIASPEALASPHWRRKLGSQSVLSAIDPAAIASADRISQWAMRAAHQAWQIASMDTIDRETTGLIFVTSWGVIDSTVAYLESMLTDGGRYASPRHFSRSVFSSVTSTLAIHFGIHGPCETLAFESRFVEGALARAWRLLAAGRCNRVLVVWAEEQAEIAEHLALQAARTLAKKAYSRYENGIGQGAVAMIVAKGELHTDALGRIDLNNLEATIRRGSGGTVPGKPFATDEALLFLSGFLSDPIDVDTCG